MSRFSVCFYHGDKIIDLGKIQICFISIAVVILFIGITWGQDNLESKSLIPGDIIIMDDYRRGDAAEIGTVRLVIGKVALIHKNEKQGYWARERFPIFEGDTLITEADGQARMSLIDKSILTLGALTKVEINQSIYMPEKRDRFTFLLMDLGKIRFQVSKFIGFHRNEFSIKTKTAIAGVRGSDFVIEVKEIKDDKFMLNGSKRRFLTAITTLDNTELEVRSAYDPTKPPVIMKSFQQVQVIQDGLPTSPRDVTPEQARQVTEDLVTGTGGNKSQNKDVDMKDEEHETREEDPPADKVNPMRTINIRNTTTSTTTTSTTTTTTTTTTSTIPPPYGL